MLDLRVFQVDHTFYKLDVKILVAGNESSCLCHTRLPSLSASAKARTTLAQAKEAPVTSLTINTVCKS